MQHNRLIAILLSTLILTVGHAASGSEKGDSALVRAMFARMNLDYSGLEKVKAAWPATTCRRPRRPTCSSGGSGPSMSCSGMCSFGSTASPCATVVRATSSAILPPVTVSWRDREKAKNRISLGKVWANAESYCRWTVREMADMLVENKLTLIRLGDPGGGVFHMPPVDMGGKWDWNFIANDNPYTNGFLHRFYWAPVLAQTYWATGDERYAGKLIDLWVDWVRSPPQSRGGDSGKHGGLGPMYQAALQPSCLAMIVQSPKLSPHDFCLMVGYLTGPTSDSLTDGLRGGNQMLSPGQAVMAVAGAFPEFKAHGHWLSIVQRCLDSTSDSLIYPDGGFAETTFLYAVVTAVELLTSVESAGKLAEKGMGITVPKRAANPECMGDYFMYNAQPDWRLPWTGHGECVDAAALLSSLARMYPHRQDFLYYATRGQKGEQPKTPSRWFNWSGYCSMRDRYDRTANYLFFDVGPCGSFHKNANKLQIVVASHGRTLLEDRGIHTYSPHKPEFNTYFNHCYGHSTVLVDGKSQPIREEVSISPLWNPWTSSTVLDYNSGEYSGGYHPTSYVAGEVDRGVRHHRSVVFVKPDYWIVTDRLLPTGRDEPDRPRTFEQLFQYIPCEITECEESLAVGSATPGEPNLALIPVSRKVWNWRSPRPARTVHSRLGRLEEQKGTRGACSDGHLSQEGGNAGGDANGPLADEGGADATTAGGEDWHAARRRGQGDAARRTGGLVSLEAEPCVMQVSGVSFPCASQRWCDSIPRAKLWPRKLSTLESTVKYGEVEGNTMQETMPRLVMFIAMCAMSSLARASDRGSEYDALNPVNCHDVVKQAGRVVDRIDETQDLPASRFKENRPSRVVDSPIGKVRQFGPEDRAGISYLLHVEKPGSPHVVRVYYPDWEESCMQVSVEHFSTILWSFGPSVLRAMTLPRLSRGIRRRTAWPPTCSLPARTCWCALLTSTLRVTILPDYSAPTMRIGRESSWTVFKRMVCG